MGNNPGNYIARRCDAGSDGNLVVSVKNETGVRVTGVRIAVEYTDSYGRAQQRGYKLGRMLDPGQIASINTGMGPYQGGSCPAAVVAATVAD